MGILVASQTRWECDEEGCTNASTPNFDQTEARKLAEDKLFSQCPTSGKVTCFECRRNKHKEHKS